MNQSKHQVKRLLSSLEVQSKQQETQAPGILLYSDPEALDQPQHLHSRPLLNTHYSPYIF